uniref:Uncharacterized protein n=1 Tax=Triticum urartu TaxID=4572 RepID=A0A8R7UC81_TRIUA
MLNLLRSTSTMGNLKPQLNCLPKLQRVKYVGWSYQQDRLIFASVPQLSKLILGKVGVSSASNIKLSELLANVAWITDLRLDFQSEKIWVLPECPKLLAPVLGKLQIANLDNLPQGWSI